MYLYMEAYKLIYGVLLLGQFYNIRQENGCKEESNLSKIAKLISGLYPDNMAS